MSDADWEEAWIDPADLSKATRDVFAERKRQQQVEGFDAAHDDQYLDWELSRAGTCYALVAGMTDAARRDVSSISPVFGIPVVGNLWPWARRFWKPKDRRRDLVRAAALIIAEIERIDRAAPATTGDAS